MFLMLRILLLSRPSTGSLNTGFEDAFMNGVRHLQLADFVGGLLYLGVHGRFLETFCIGMRWDFQCDPGR